MLSREYLAICTIILHFIRFVFVNPDCILNMYNPWLLVLMSEERDEAFES